MKKYVCKICGYVYDPAENNDVPFEELPEDWTCPICGVGKDQFEVPRVIVRKRKANPGRIHIVTTVARNEIKPSSAMMPNGEKEQAVLSYGMGTDRITKPITSSMITNPNA